MLCGCSIRVIVATFVFMPTLSYSSLIISYSLFKKSKSSPSAILIISPAMSIVHTLHTTTIIIDKPNLQFNYC